MIQLFKQNKEFLVPYFVVFIPISVCLLIFPKADIHIFFNKFHTNFLDFLIPNLTNLGDGFVYFGFIFILLFVKYRYSLASLISLLISMPLMYILKQIIFNNLSRPRTFFNEIYLGSYKLYLVPGTNPEMMDSFPSGHTTTAFAMFFILSAIIKNKILKFIFFILAISVGYTRIYMSNHFLVDVAGGSFLGLSASFLAVHFSNKLKKQWIEKSIIIQIKKV